MLSVCNSTWNDDGSGDWQPPMKPPVLLILLTALQGASPLIPSAPVAAGAPPIFLLPEKQPLWPPAVILETHMEKSSRLLCWSFRQIWNITQTDMHLLWHNYLGGNGCICMQDVCVFLCVAEWDHGNVWGPGSIWIFYYYFLLTQRRNESFGLGKKPQQTINRNCVHFWQPLCFRTPSLSRFLTFVSPIIMDKSLWLSGT